jgi:hypothetical protein
MKKFMITGGLLGFSIGLISGWLQQTDWPALLWRASVAALVAGLLMRWWARLWTQTVQEVCERQRAARNQETASASLPLAAKP